MTSEAELLKARSALDEAEEELGETQAELQVANERVESKDDTIRKLNDRVTTAEDEVDRIREEFDPAIKAEREAAEQKAEAERAEAERRATMTEQQRLDDECSLVEPDQLQRDPDASKGECYLLVASVNQWDGATGPCSFLADYDRQSHDYSYEYAGDSGIFVADEPCEMFDGMDVDDTIKLWVYNGGVFTYDTAIGGSNTTVVFSVRAAELVRKG